VPKIVTAGVKEDLAAYTDGRANAPASAHMRRIAEEIEAERPKLRQ
jgi:hypothetical protein